MSLINVYKQCRVCAGNLTNILFLGNHFLHGSFVYPDFQPPQRKSPVTLTKCDDCHLVQLRESLDPDILYARYGYRSSTNQTMREHLTKITAKAISYLPEGPVGRYVLDIGCNDGFLLKQYPKEFRKVGVDPCDIGCKITDIDNFKFINSVFPTKELSGEKFSIVSMISCFYDVNNPTVVAQNIKYHLSDSGVAVVEVSYWPTKMARHAIDEICQEHVCFYSYQNLEGIFTSAGLKVIDVEINEINGGSIQVWLAKEDNQKVKINRQAIQKVKFAEFEMKLDETATYTRFEHESINLYRKINELFTEISRDNKKVHLYGASTKGNVLLQYAGLNNKDIPYAAERSKEKVGGKTLGTNIQMISEEDSRAMKPDYYFVPIWGFRDEIIVREKAYIDNGGALIFPLPELEIVTKDGIKKL